jgi:hypothetical protein
MRDPSLMLRMTAAIQSPTMQQPVNSFNKASVAKAIRKAERQLAKADPIMRLNVGVD